MKKALARVIDVLPKWLRDRVRDRYWRVKSKFLYQSLYRALDLEHTLLSGLNVKIASKGEWWVYNDIFVDGEYDMPIQAAFKDRSPGRPFVVLDLGANVGYFALRVLDLLDRESGEKLIPQITMIEGSPKTFLELEKRIGAQRQFTAGIRMVHGLVGQARGSGIIQESALHVKSTTVNIPAGHGVKVDFVDIDSLMADQPEIDLLKCDIEGAELLFIQNYAGLLRKVRHAVFELHHDQCDTKECVQTLEVLGFHQINLRTTNSFSVSLFSKN